MQVIATAAVDIAIRSLSEEDRRTVRSLLHHLANWENDEFLRQRSQRLPSSPDVYALMTSGEDIWIIFRLAKDRLEVLDIVRNVAIQEVGRSGSNR